MNKICIYLRKSRADEELEKTLGEGETLYKHRKALLKFAKENNLNITEIKEELISADSIIHRPKMVELLKEVESNLYDGVLVMDIQRLGRGDTEDQGMIFRIFKDSHTNIITPQKTYNLDDDYDEDYFEFESFMGRKEYKMIKKRMQGGRVRSVEDGNYIATNPPLGYDIEYIKKSRTLKINEHESEIIKLIFTLYTKGDGAGTIATYLNSLGYKTKTNNSFGNSSIIAILKNPIYIGKITWKKKEYKKSKSPNKVKDCRTRDKNEWIISNGKHPALIDEDTFNRANEILSEKYHIPYKHSNPPTNPLAGLVICGVCDNKMIMRKYNGIPRIMCTHKCGNRSVRFDYFEKDLLRSLEDYLQKYKFSIENKKNDTTQDMYSKQLALFNKELNALNTQSLNVFDAYERNVYPENVFIERMQNINTRKENISNEINKLSVLLDQESKRISSENITLFENIIKGYKNTTDVKLKNELFKTIISKVVYNKAIDQKNDEFNIDLYPKLLR